MPTWSGIIQSLESGKASEQPVVNDGDLVAGKIPVEGGMSKHGDIRMMRWVGCDKGM